jgi:hypothetical protein
MVHFTQAKIVTPFFTSHITVGHFFSFDVTQQCGSIYLAKRLRNRVRGVVRYPLTSIIFQLKKKQVLFPAQINGEE